MCIIKIAQNQNRFKGDGNYYEAHHILPKSFFPNWKKRKSNIVLLTAREHFFCHQLLTKIYNCKEMKQAVVAFYTRPNADYKISSREYEKLQKMNAELARQRFLGKRKNPESVKKSANTRRGSKRSEEAKALMSKKQKELWASGAYANVKRKAGHWYTNDEQNIFIIEGEHIPVGFKRGRVIDWSKTHRKYC